MLFLTLMKVLPGRATDQPGTLKRISSVAPPSGIKIHGVYFLFGRYDGAILFEGRISEQPKTSFCERQRNLYNGNLERSSGRRTLNPSERRLNHICS